MIRKSLYLILGLILLAATTWAEPKADDMMILVIGPSAQRIDPNEARVVARLNALLEQSAYARLTVATIHFDRPQEADFAKQVLGVTAAELPLLCLVELDPATRQPIRRISSVPRVRAANLDCVDKMAATWAQAAAVTEPEPPRPKDPGNQGSEIYSYEGVSSVIRELDALASDMWDQTKNLPLLREDGSDQPSRRALLGVAEYSHNLREALDRGIENPREQMEGVLYSRDRLTAQQPELFLPVAVRPSIPRLVELLNRVEDIYRQLNPGP